MTLTTGRVQRRQLLQSWAGSSMLLPAIVAELLASEDSGTSDALQSRHSGVRIAHFTPRAKRVIVVFLQGGLSHLDSFDPKPRLWRDAGRVLPEGRLLASLWKFHRRGESGIPVSDLFPYLSHQVDDL